MKLTHKKSSAGQAIVEFALILTILLAIIFLIVEASRIMWGWVTVQNAARDGARYAITGQVDPNCLVASIPKYAALCSDPQLQRPASIVGVTHNSLTGLPLNEDATSVFEDPDYYAIEVYGVDESGQLRGTNLPAPFGPAPYAGSPNNPVVIRVTYRVPIVTPFFSAIVESIPVFGQTTLYNESFGQLGGTGQSAGPPPPIPDIPTPGVTPTSTSTPTPGPTSTTSPTPESTATATSEPCPVAYTSDLVAGFTYASVTGLWNAGGSTHTVTFYDITAGGDPLDSNDTRDPVTLAENVPMASATGNDDVACPGVGDTALPAYNLDPPLIGGHRILVIHTDGTFAVGVVQAGTSTPTATATSTVTSTPATPPSPTATATDLPDTAFIQVVPQCVNPDPSGFASISVSGFNYDNGAVVSLFVNGSSRGQIQPSEIDNEAFQRTLTVPVLTNEANVVQAVSVGAPDAQATFIAPCPNITPTPVTATPTSTPAPEDLIIVSEPVLISTPPIVEYQPVEFQVVITNTGGVPVLSQFFVDVFFDPAEVFDTYIPLQYSDGYIAVGSLSGGASRVLTVTSSIGFTGGEMQREVFGMVDSLEAIGEAVETNNIASGLNVDIVTAVPPTPSPTPSGDNVIAGYARSYRNDDWSPQPRALLWLQEADNSSAPLLGPFRVDEIGDFSITGIPSGVTYTLFACLRTDTVDFVFPGRSVSAPSIGVGVFLSADEAGCPYLP